MEGGIMQEHPAEHLILPENTFVAEDRTAEQAKEKAARRSEPVHAGEAGKVRGFLPNRWILEVIGITLFCIELLSSVPTSI